MLNWRRNLVLTVLYLIAFFLQYGVLSNLGWGVFCPQLLLFFPVYAGVLRGSLSGLVHGVLCGLLHLIALLSVFLVHAANSLLYALMIGLLSGSFFSMTFISKIILGGALVNCFLAPVIYVPVYRSLLYGVLRPLTKQN